MILEVFSSLNDSVILGTTMASCAFSDAFRPFLHHPDRSTWVHRGFGGLLSPPGFESRGAWAGVLAGLVHPGVGTLFPPWFGGWFPNRAGARQTKQKGEGKGGVRSHGERGKILVIMGSWGKSLEMGEAKEFWGAGELQGPIRSCRKL